MDKVTRSALLLGFAALLGAAQDGGAGQGPPAGTRVEDLPPEIRAVLPPGAVLSGPPVSDGEAVYDVPRPAGAPVLDSLPLAADTVIASETMQLQAFHSRLAGRLAVGPPFSASHPAGTDVPRLVKNGVVRNCIRQRGTYVPPQDERGEIYPGLCIEDRDGDGRYETAIFLPYRPDRAHERIMTIVTPVQIEPNPAAMAEDPEALRATRRIRVTRLGPDDAQITLEQGVGAWRQADIAGYFGRPEDSAVLPLRDGASGSLGGIDFLLRRDGTGWRIAATGRFTPWLEVRDNGDLIMAGGMEFRRPPPRYP